MDTEDLDNKSSTSDLDNRSDVSDIPVHYQPTDVNLEARPFDKILVIQNSDDYSVFAKKLETMKDEQNNFRSELTECYRVVLDFIKRRERIIVGGMAIDYALKAKGDKLYDTLKIDYDFISPEYHLDAYDLGSLLAKDFSDISIIGAKHISTMKVRYKGMVVADITYVPKVLYDKVQYITYEDIRCIHPHFQMVDQLRALRNMAENPPTESYLSDRIEKDIKRFHMLSMHYQFDPIDLPDEPHITHTIDLSILKGQCIAGYLSAIYWMDKTKLKTKSSMLVHKSTLKCTMPEKYNIGIFTDDAEQLLGQLPKNPTLEYNSFLDKMPKRIVTGKYEIFDGNGELHVAEILDKKRNIWVMGIYGTATWLLIQYLYYADQTAGHIFIHLWKLLCTKFVSLVPHPIEFYGRFNWSDSYLLALQKHKAAMQGKQLSWLLPKNAYPEKSKSVSEQLYLFDPTKSYILQIDGQEKNKLI